MYKNKAMLIANTQLLYNLTSKNRRRQNIARSYDKIVKKQPETKPSRYIYLSARNNLNNTFGWVRTGAYRDKHWKHICDLTNKNDCVIPYKAKVVISTVQFNEKKKYF